MQQMSRMPIGPYATIYHGYRSLYTARTIVTLLQKYSNIVFMNSVMSSRITIAKYCVVAEP